MTKSAATQSDTTTVGAQFIAPAVGEVMNGWRKYKTSSLIDDGLLTIGDGYRAKNSELVQTGLAFARAGNINNGFLFDGADCLPESYVEIAGEKVSRVGDVVFTSKGTVGRFGFVRDGIAKFVYSPQLCFWRSKNHNEIDPRFLYYWMHGKEFLDQVESVKGQTDMADYVNLSDQRNMSITLPAPKDQKAIAAMLSSLDDKIDLLHRQNQTLEAMAQTLFRQWFIEEAREDWETKKIKDLVEIQSGFAFKSSTFSDVGKYKLITIKAVQDGYLDITNADEIDFIADKVPSYCILVKNDILLSLTGNVGRCCLVDRTNLLLNQRVAKLKPIEDSNWAFTYILFRQTAMKQNLEDLSKGSAQANLSPIETGLIEIVVPKDDFFIKFSAEVTPLMLKVMSNKIQIQTLTQLRDTLLPKLMSGEIRVEVEYE